MNDRTLTPPMQGPARFHQPDDDARRRPLAAIGAALALLLLVVGVPAGLVALAGPPPVPTGLPSQSDLTQPIGTDLLLTVLLGVVWLAWALFVVSVVVEVASALRGGGLPRHVPFAGPAQTLARVLVGALLIGSTVAGPGAAAAQHVVADAPVAAAVADRAGDERDGERDGERGGAGAESGPAGMAAPFSDVEGLAGKRVYVVNAPRDGYHDNLWDIADRHLGDGRRYKEIYRLNEGREQPDGRTLQLARLIQPGWNLVMPDDAVGVPRVQPGGVQAGPRPGGAGGAASDAGHGAADQGMTDLSGDQAGADEGMSPSVIGALSGAGLVSAGVLAALVLHRRRRRGMDPDADAAETEVRLRAAATPDRARWFLAALRDLGQACLAARTAPPSVYAAVLDDDAVELWLAPANGATVGDWEALDEGRRWRRRRTPEVTGRGGFAPYPAMVSLGVDDRGRDVLVDLEAAGGPVAVDGDSVVAAQVASAIAVQLGTSPWSGNLRVTASDVPDLVAGIGDDRITVVDDLTSVLPGLEASCADFTTDVLHGRMARRQGVVPHFVVCGGRPEPEVVDRLHALVGASRQAFGTVCVGTSDSARWTMRVDEAGTLSMPLMDIAVAANRLNDAEVRHIAALFAATRADAAADGLAGGRPPVPQPVRDADDAAWTTSDVRVGVLGPVEVRTPDSADSPPPERLALATEIVAFLALHPSGVHPNVLAGAVWPKGVTDEVRDSNIERVRAWLGQDRGGDLHLREDEVGRLLLGPDVVVDWHCLCGLLRRSRAASTLEVERDLLTRALRLVRGPLLAGHEEQRYSWLARTHLERTVAAVVTDAAHRLAEILRDDDPSGAGAAAEAGLRLEPTCLLLWRDLLSSQYRRDGAAGAHRVLEVMGTTLEEYDVPTDPETDALIEELIPGQGFLPRTS